MKDDGGRQVEPVGIGRAVLARSLAGGSRGIDNGHAYLPDGKLRPGNSRAQPVSVRPAELTSRQDRVAEPAS